MTTTVTAVTKSVTPVTVIVTESQSLSPSHSSATLPPPCRHSPPHLAATVLPTLPSQPSSSLRGRLGLGLVVRAILAVALVSAGFMTTNAGLMTTSATGMTPYVTFVAETVTNPAEIVTNPAENRETAGKTSSQTRGRCTGDARETHGRCTGDTRGVAANTTTFRQPLCGKQKGPNMMLDPLYQCDQRIKPNQTGPSPTDHA